MCIVCGCFSKNNGTRVMEISTVSSGIKYRGVVHIIA
jgi:hypothetical protein